MFLLLLAVFLILPLFTESHTNSEIDEELLRHNKRMRSDMEKIALLIILVPITLILWGILCLNHCGFSGCVLFCYLPFLLLVFTMQILKS